jgi:hypothetical protein
MQHSGELGYALSVSFGAVMDNPDLVVACVVGDGEAETGPTAAYVYSVLGGSLSENNVISVGLGTDTSILTLPSRVQCCPSCMSMGSRYQNARSLARWTTRR